MTRCTINNQVNSTHEVSYSAMRIVQRSYYLNKERDHEGQVNVDIYRLATDIHYHPTSITQYVVYHTNSKR